jgi:hypothetical protein
VNNGFMGLKVVGKVGREGGIKENNMKLIQNNPKYFKNISKNQKIIRK